MNQPVDTPTTDDIKPAPTPLQFSLDLILGFWHQRIVWVAARLRLADVIGDKPRTVEEIAQTSGAAPAALHRLLDALTSAGIFRREDDGRYAQTARSQLLRSDHVDSQRALIDVVLGGESFEAWGALEAALRSGGTAFDIRYGMSWIDYYAANPEEGCHFAEAMTGTTRAFEEAVLTAHRFEDFTLAVDVGGSHGSLIHRLLARQTKARGVVFDLPAVAAAGPALWARSPEADRLEAVGGDFFASVPEGDLYLLKFILHDWDDERSLVILNNIRRAIRPGGRVAVIETLIPEDGRQHPGWLMDINMLVMTGGRERTLGHYAKLLAAAGFRLDRVTTTASPLSVVEAVVSEPV